MDDIIDRSVNTSIDVKQKSSLPFLLKSFYFKSATFLDMPHRIELHMAIRDTLK